VDGGDRTKLNHHSLNDVDYAVVWVGGEWLCSAQTAKPQGEEAQTVETALIQALLLVGTELRGIEGRSLAPRHGAIGMALNEADSFHQGSRPITAVTGHRICSFALDFRGFEQM
jgi:hypothetical protein